MQVYEALNALGEVGWRINREMLDVISHAWSREMDICSFPQYQEQPVTPAPQRYRLPSFQRQVVAGQLVHAWIDPPSTNNDTEWNLSSFQMLIVADVRGCSSLVQFGGGPHCTCVCKTASRVSSRRLTARWGHG